MLPFGKSQIKLKEVTYASQKLMSVFNQREQESSRGLMFGVLASL